MRKLVEYRNHNRHFVYQTQVQYIILGTIETTNSLSSIFIPIGSYRGSQAQTFILIHLFSFSVVWLRKANFQAGSGSTEMANRFHPFRSVEQFFPSRASNINRSNSPNGRETAQKMVKNRWIWDDIPKLKPPSEKFVFILRMFSRLATGQFQKAKHTWDLVKMSSPKSGRKPHLQAARYLPMMCATWLINLSKLYEIVTFYVLDVKFAEPI